MKKKLSYIDKAMVFIVAVTILIAAFAMLVGMDIIAIGEGGIQLKTY